MKEKSTSISKAKRLWYLREIQEAAKEVIRLNHGKDIAFAGVETERKKKGE